MILRKNIIKKIAQFSSNCNTFVKHLHIELNSSAMIDWNTKYRETFREHLIPLQFVSILSAETKIKKHKSKMKMLFSGR